MWIRPHRFDMSEYAEKFAASRLSRPQAMWARRRGGPRKSAIFCSLIWWGGKSHPDIFNVLCKSWMVLTDQPEDWLLQYHYHHDLKPGSTALRDDKTVGFGAGPSQYGKTHVWKSWKKTYRQSLSTGLMKRLHLAYQRGHAAGGRKSWSNRSLRPANWP